MTVVSNGQFWIFTAVLLLIWIIVLTTALNDEYKSKHKISLPQTIAENDLKYTRICKNLCKLCNCLGFYCGEECICECNEDHADTECIKEVRRNAQSSNIPYEVLIQGPSANKFVRTALLYEQNQERKLYADRSKRSTVTVYKPSKANLNMQKYCCEKKTAFKDIFKATDNSKKRRKRSSGNNHFEWFNNLGTNLLRPAPLGGRKPQVEVTQRLTTQATTVSSIFDKSWIFDSFDDSRNILTPRPLKKPKSPQTSSENNGDLSTNESGMKNEAESTYASNDDELKDDFPEAEKVDYNYSEESKDTKPNKKESFLPDEADVGKSQDNLVDSLYSQLFENDLGKTDDEYPLALDREYQEEPLESPLHNDELSQIENDKINLFLEDVEEEEKSKGSKSSDLSKSQNDLSTTEKLLPLNIQKRLQELRMPWFKPGKLLQKFRQVITS